MTCNPVSSTRNTQGEERILAAQRSAEQVGTGRFAERSSDAIPMPSTLLPEMDRLQNGQLEADQSQRAFQIALELSMLGLTSDDDSGSNSFDELRNKKSMNMTECVPVPSSEHVAEIVGRQGKFLSFRAKKFQFEKVCKSC